MNTYCSFLSLFLLFAFSSCCEHDFTSVHVLGLEDRLSGVEDVTPPTGGNGAAERCEGFAENATAPVDSGADTTAFWQIINGTDCVLSLLT